MTPENPGLRLSILGVVALSLFAALFARLYFLQMLEDQDLRQEVSANRLRVVHEQAPRGRILDREQRVLIDSHEVDQVTVDVRVLEDETDGDPERKREVFRALARELATAQVPSEDEDRKSVV